MTSTALLAFGHALVALALVPFLYLRLKAYLLFFQQEEYDGGRFVRWLRRARARDRRASLAAGIAGVLVIATPPEAELLHALADALILAGLGLGMRLSRRPLGRAKKPLVMTARARRILALALLFALALGILVWVFVGVGSPLAPALATLVLTQIAPYCLVIADYGLKPLERRIRARYREEARAKLKALDPLVIGITGSYGKTSTKHILAHILESAAPTLATPGSVNTEMGISRIVREELAPHHRYFIAEMGAYGPGSIARLCRLAPPKLGIITGVGVAHYERFGDIDTVFDAKFELADAVAAAGGCVIVIGDAVPGKRLRARLLRDGAHLRLIGNVAGSALRLGKAHQTRAGLELEVEGEGISATLLKVPLYGLHQAHNVLAAVAAALELGLPLDMIRAALATTPQIRHRLEVVTRGGITVIDDAYNANPEGFAAALALLDSLVGDGGRRILVTPGMVELGARHEAEHARLGALAAQHADIALVVAPARITSFVDAFEGAMPPGASLERFDNQAAAEAWVNAHASAGDVVLFENNLPDLYEMRPVF
ncbi:MAG: UDP-N-acetylmuramoyl-tripeptide--D-alanyl-D-alanine ligase [Alphaproteobacteria bacterium]|nr:MAG: UDP-N-acetylmuramoyl-tripeptide--D-alanyl-D-alanine ligase [Alphaproteobacteria bacterium]